MAFLIMLMVVVEVVDLMAPTAEVLVEMVVVEMVIKLLPRLVKMD